LGHLKPINPGNRKNGQKFLIISNLFYLKTFFEFAFLRCKQKIRKSSAIRPIAPITRFKFEPISDFVRLGPIRSDSVRLGPIRPDSVRFGPIFFFLRRAKEAAFCFICMSIATFFSIGPTSSDFVRLGPIRSDSAWLRPIWSDSARLKKAAQLRRLRKFQLRFLFCSTPQESRIERDKAMKPIGEAFLV